MFMTLASKRRRLGAVAPPEPPANITAPALTLVGEDTLTYTPGVWEGEPPIVITARLFIDGVDTAPATPSMAIQDAWRERGCSVREAATNIAGGPVFALSQEVRPPALRPPEEALEALLAGRLGYAVDPRDLATLFQDSTAAEPVTEVGQLIGSVRTKFGAAPYSFIQATASLQPLYADGVIDPDGVDDMLDMGAAATALFANVIDGYVVCVKLAAAAALTPGSVFGSGNMGNAASRVYDMTIAANGTIGFWARVPLLTSFPSAAGVWRPNEDLILTMDVNYLTKRVRGFANGVQVVSTETPDAVPRANTVNRHRLFATSTDGATRTNLSLKRACFLHHATDDAGLRTMERWVGEF
jgi:hypothetical protein